MTILEIGMTNIEQNILPHKNGKAYGYWEIYHKVDIMWYKCFYINDVEHGFEEIYNKEGELRVKQYHAK
jgi:hypothetical protein